MSLRRMINSARLNWRVMTAYQKFEQIVVFILTFLMAIIIVAAVWNLALKIFTMVVAQGLDPTTHDVFQSIFGMIFIVIIALEFKRSILVVAERRDSIVHVRAVILIAMLAVVRKLIIFDFEMSNAAELFALAGAILALGAVYWLVRDQDRRERRKSAEGESA